MAAGAAVEVAEPAGGVPAIVAAACGPARGRTGRRRGCRRGCRGRGWGGCAGCGLDAGLDAPHRAHLIGGGLLRPVRGAGDTLPGGAGTGRVVVDRVGQGRHQVAPVAGGLDRVAALQRVTGVARRRHADGAGHLAPARIPGACAAPPVRAGPGRIRGGVLRAVAVRPFACRAGAQSRRPPSGTSRRGSCRAASATDAVVGGEILHVAERGSEEVVHPRRAHQRIATVVVAVGRNQTEGVVRRGDVAAVVVGDVLR